MTAVATLLLSGVFATAGVTKLRGQLAFRAVVRQLVPGRAVAPLAVTIPIAELGIVGLLLSGISPRLAGIASLAILGLFSLVLAQMWRSGASMDCGCFGETPEAATPLSGLIRNVGLIVLACLVLINGDAVLTETSSDDAGAAITLAIAVACAWSGGLAMFTHRAVLFPAWARR